MVENGKKTTKNVKKSPKIDEKRGKMIKKWSKTTENIKKAAKNGKKCKIYQNHKFCKILEKGGERKIEVWLEKWIKLKNN